MKLRTRYVCGQIVKHRKAKGVKRSQLAEWTKINYRRLGSIERGEINPSLDELANIVMALELTMLDMFYDRGDLLAIGEHWVRNRGLIRDIVGKLLSFERHVDEHWLEYCKKHLLPYFCKLLGVEEVPDVKFTRDNAPEPPWYIRNL